MKCRLLVSLPAGKSVPDDHPGIVVEGSHRTLREGTIIEHCQAYRLVQGGFAEAMDDECKATVESLGGVHGVARVVHERILREQQEFRDEIEAEDNE